MSLTSLPVTRRTVLGSAIGLSATALIAGCAKKDNASSTGGGKQVLNVGQISNSVAFFPLYVAEQKGFFTKAGVTLGDRPRLGTGAKLAAALKSGSIDLGAGVLTDAYNLHSTDSNARVYSGLVTEYYVDVVVGTSYSGPAADAPIDQRIQSLVGKKIGITGPVSGTEALLVYLFQQIG
jgi:ABC-type nitrate/sulfonate/bicarbonate transport system substrate-binding protein